MGLFKKKFSLAKMKKIEAKMLQQYKKDSRKFKKSGDMASHWYQEAMIGTIKQKFSGSAWACMLQAAELGHTRAMSIRDHARAGAAHPKLLLIQNLQHSGEGMIIGDGIPRFNPRFRNQMIEAQSLITTGDKKAARNMLMKMAKQGSFEAYILLKAPNI